MPENNALAGGYITIDTQDDTMAMSIIMQIYCHPSK